MGHTPMRRVACSRYKLTSNQQTRYWPYGMLTEGTGTPTSYCSSVALQPPTHRSLSLFLLLAMRNALGSDALALMFVWAYFPLCVLIRRCCGSQAQHKFFDNGQTDNFLIQIFSWRLSFLLFFSLGSSVDRMWGASLVLSSFSPAWGLCSFCCRLYNLYNT